MSGAVIRRLRAGDLDAVVAGLAAHPPHQHRRHLELQDRGGFVCLIAWVEGEPAGFAGLALDEEAEALCEGRGFATVSELSVEEPYRRRGVGRALMEALEQEARAAGKPGIALETGTDERFAAARALYRSLGYLEQGGVYLGGWSDPDRPGVHFVDPLTQWRKAF